MEQIAPLVLEPAERTELIALLMNRFGRSRESVDELIRDAFGPKELDKALPEMKGKGTQEILTELVARSEQAGGLHDLLNSASELRTDSPDVHTFVDRFFLRHPERPWTETRTRNLADKIFFHICYRLPIGTAEQAPRIARELAQAAGVTFNMSHNADDSAYPIPLIWSLCRQARDQSLTSELRDAFQQRYPEAQLGKRP